MSFFTKPLTETATISRSPDLAGRLLEIEKEYRLREREFTDACFGVTQWRARHNRRFVLEGRLYEPSFSGPIDPQLKLLERQKSEALERRNGLLQERAALRQKLGIQ